MQKTMKMFLMAGMALSLLAGASWADPPAWAPAHGRRAQEGDAPSLSHRYHYYPGAQVYFDDSRDLYFYLKDGDWVRSATIPAGIEVDLADFVRLDIDAEIPYLVHDQIRERYSSVREVQTYRYFPSAAVYFGLAGGLYHYQVNGVWRTAKTLPGTINVRANDFVTVRLTGDNPVVHHQEIVSKYPPGQVKKHHKKKWKHKGKGKVKGKGK